MNQQVSRQRGAASKRPREEFKPGNGTAREFGAKEGYVALAQASFKPAGGLAAAVYRKKGCKSALATNMSTPGVEPGLSRPQRDVLTTRRCGPCGGVPDNAARGPKTVPKPSSTQSQPQDSFRFAGHKGGNSVQFFAGASQGACGAPPTPLSPPFPGGGGGDGGVGGALTTPTPAPPPLPGAKPRKYTVWRQARPTSKANHVCLDLSESLQQDSVTEWLR